MADIRRAFVKLKETCQCCVLGKDAQREERAQRSASLRAGRPPRKNAKKIEGGRCSRALTRGSVAVRQFLTAPSARHRILRAALQDAVSEGILTQNIAKNLRLSQRYRPKSFGGLAPRSTVPEDGQDDRLYALYAMALSLGLRRGEALGLRWSDC